MKKRQILRAAAGLGLLAAPAYAQAPFPSSRIRMVVAFPPGGNTDIFGRLFAEPFGQALGQPVVIDNRGGAGGLIGSGEVHRARPDGYTLIFQSPTAGITGPLTRRVPPFDPVTGFSHISILGITPLCLAVNPQLGVNNLAELIAMIRAQPGRLSYGSSGIGGVPHLATELLRIRAGNLDVVHVPYRGSGPLTQDLLSGVISFAVDAFTALLPQHREGKLKIISVFGEQRAAVVPEVPTAREDGFDVVIRLANYLAAPPGTPPDRLERLSAAARAVMSTPEMARALEAMAFVPVTDSTPERATRFIADEAALWRPVIRATNIEID
jgi:tripartite-type tricarboxylate transporter receptor subunit TctC